MSPQKSEKRNVALCYVRLSVTRDASDLTSPERQRANIKAACDKYGWIPEWYEDAKGHKSATKEENRPEWLLLKSRLKDDDVVAVVVNEQSRAMRNAWRAIKLFEELPHYGVKLHLASIDRTIDITTPDGRMTAYFQAFMDDLYALDASRRAKDSVRYRKGKGQSIGIPPFGTIRNESGFLTPSPYGAWLMPDGTLQPGKDRNQAPHPDAVWRGYYECAERILQIYKDNLHGYLYIANQLNSEGWAFRDRNGNPRLLTLDDVRRVTSAWREYAGLMTQGKARDRIASKIENPTQVLYETGRAVFDLNLLQAVARTQENRSFITNASKVKREAHVFALSHLLYCARCEANASSHEDVKLRSRLIGWQKQGKFRYRHSESNRCGCQTNSLYASEIEDDFARLINVLDVNADAIDLMAALAVESRFDNLDGSNEAEFEEQKRVNLAKHRRAVKNNMLLFQSGDIDDAEYFRQKDFHERQIVYWESRTSDRQKITLELTTCREMVKRIQQFWDITTGEDRRILAQSLFDEVVYDLDARRIVDFRIKAWAEPFLELRAALYEDDMGEEMKNRFNSGVSSDGSYFSPNGVRTRVFTLKG
ncbi:MAG: recombinase family protein [Anaerolineae bacterium]|nr:recombinase family protein [Anaerolineae bacterium]